MRSQDLVRELEVSPMTAQNRLTAFGELNILQKVTGYHRNRIDAFDRYLALFRS